MILIPAWIVTVVFMLDAALCAYSSIKYKDWTGVIFAPVLFAFAVLYWNYSTFEIDVYIRAVQVRIGIVAIGATILFWRGAELWLQTRRGWK